MLNGEHVVLKDVYGGVLKTLILDTDYSNYLIFYWCDNYTKKEGLPMHRFNFEIHTRNPNESEDYLNKYLANVFTKVPGLRMVTMDDIKRVLSGTAG